MQKRLASFIFILCLFLACSAAQAGDDRRVTLSGRAEDTFIAHQDCYAEGENVVVFFQQGMTVRGDMLSYVEEVMDDLCRFTGLSFEQTYPSGDYSLMFDDYFEPGVFRHVNADREKINLLAVNFTTGVQWACESMAVVDVTDLERDNPLVLYHELSHTLYMRNAPDLGSCLNEGLATYTVDRLCRVKGIANWDTIPFLTAPDFDAGCIDAGVEGFSICFPNTDDNYCYGYRFVTFLCETYGQDIIAKLLAAATADHFDAAFGEDAAADILADTEQMKKIIVSITQEDVFDRFAQWHRQELSRLLEEFFAYIDPLSTV